MYLSISAADAAPIRRRPNGPCMDALASAISDYEDAVVEKVASRKDMDYIVTRNIKDYQAGGTKIILPDDFVKLVEEE